MQIFLESFLMILLGLCAGSFATMASHRLVLEDEKISDLIFKRSHCPKCNNNLTARNLIPLLSWIIQKGKCSFCYQKISIRYPLIEFISASIFLLIYLLVGKIIDTKLVLMLLIATLLIITVITDLENYLIPDAIQIGLFILVIFYHLFVGDEYELWRYFLSGFVFLIFGLALYYGFFLVTKKHGIGIGDVKFFGIAGFMLGLEQFPIFMFLSGTLGIFFGVIWKRITKEVFFPFAPSLVVSLMICLLFGNKINYLNMFLFSNY